MRRFLQHKWVIGAGALLLVVALGTVAWAATDSTTTPSATPQAGPAGGGLGFLGGMMGGGGMMRRGQGGSGGAVDPQQFQQDRQQRQADRQARQEAFLNLIREKMSVEDKQKLDSLTATAKTQRDALEAARTALGQTTSDLRDLVDKYFPGGTAPESGGTSVQPDSSTTAPSATTN